MKLRTVIRVHGYPQQSLSAGARFETESFVKLNNQDEAINKLIAEGAVPLDVHTIYDETRGLLIDIFLLQVIDDEDSEDENYQDSDLEFEIDPDLFSKFASQKFARGPFSNND